MSLRILNFVIRLSSDNDPIMKKYILLLFVFSLAGGLTAESLWLEHESTVETGTVSDFEVVSHNAVVNTGTAPMTVKVTRRIIVDNASFDNAICWQLCYLPTTDTTPDPLVLNPGDTVLNFSGHLYPNGNLGTTTIEYIFYDVDNPSNQWSYEVEYNVFGVGLEENELAVSAPYPNPANDVVRFDIQNAEPATIEVYDMLGKIVAQRTVSAREGEVTLRVQHLQPGLYFCTVRSQNGDAVQTKRLVIQR